MQIHRILGDDLATALQRARATHGEQALVVGHETLADGSVALSVTSSGRGASPGPAGSAAHAAGQDRGPSGAGTVTRPHPGLSDLERRLVQHGTSARWAAEIARTVERRGASGTLAIDAAVEVIGGRIAIAPSPKAGDEPLVIAFAGASGVGKTTTLAKLAVRLTQARRRVALLTLDHQRVGAIAQLEAYGELLGAPVSNAGTFEELTRAIGRRGRAQVLLLDTPAINPRDPERVRELAHLCTRLGREVQLRVYAVLAATTQRSDLRDGLGVLSQLRPSAAVITKLDETRRPGGALECIARARLPLAFTTTGRDAAAGLMRPTADQCADLLLRGRVA